MITDRICIGDDSDARQPDSAIDCSLNTAIDLDIPLSGGNLHRHKVGLIDGPGNDEFTLLSAVLMLHSLNRKYRRILTHCQDGKSRSVMVVAAYISIVGNMEFEKVLNDIMKARGATEYRPDLKQQYIQLLPTIKRLIRP